MVWRDPREIFCLSDIAPFTVQLVENQLLENQLLGKFLQDKRLERFIRKPSTLQSVRTSKVVRESRALLSTLRNEKPHSLSSCQGQVRALHWRDKIKVFYILDSNYSVFLRAVEDPMTGDVCLCAIVRDGYTCEFCANAQLFFVVIVCLL